VRKHFSLIVFNLIVQVGLLNAQSSINEEDNIVGLFINSSRNNVVSLNFDKSFNTYHWTGIAFYNNSFGRVKMQINEQFISTLIKTDRKLITDNQNFDFKFRYKLNSKLSAASNVNSFILSDNKSLGGSISKASSHVMYGGLAYQPFEEFTFEPLIGFRIDNQIDQQDNGLSYQLGLISNDWDYHGYLTTLRGLFQYDQIQPRTLETYNVSLRIEKEFFEQTHNYFQLNYYHNRRDFYTLADSMIQKQQNIRYNIESRTDNSIALMDSLNYSVSSKMLWTFYGNILTKDIERDNRYLNLIDAIHSPLNTNVNELKIEGGVNLFYTFSDRLKSFIGFHYQERDEKHKLMMPSDFPFIGQYIQTEERKNNHTKRTSLTGSTLWAASSSDTVSISGSANVLHYDTPSLNNNDDRDELWYLLNLNTIHNISRFLILKTTLDINLVHLVYLFSARSADNNWNRILRLSPTIIYSPVSSFRTANSFEVLANYTVYDFEYLTSQTRSYVFRQFGFLDSTSYHLTERTSIEWFSHVRLYERGELKWSSFTEHPINYFEDKTMITKIHYSITKSLLLSLGFRYFSQLRFDYVKDKTELKYSLKSVGPLASIEFINNRLSLLIQGWYETQRQTDQIVRNLGTLTINLSMNL